MHEPYEPHHPTASEDLSNLSTIALAALSALAATGLLAQMGPQPALEADFATINPVPVVEIEIVDPAAGADRLYGNVTLTDGTELTGYMRWNGREASWADLLPATHRGSRALAGVRFGHIDMLQPIDSRSMRLTLKSGEVVDMTAILSDRASTPRPMTVTVLDAPVVSPDGQWIAYEESSASVTWNEIATVEFLHEPVHMAPPAERIHGTLVTRTGLEFTGYIAWNLDEVALDQTLFGRSADGIIAVTYGDIASIQRVHRTKDQGVLVLLHSGEEFVLQGSSDVNDWNRGVTVADPTLGSVTVPWDRFSELRLHAPEEISSYDRFTGGELIVGTVTTASGEALTGSIRWDLDESMTWEMLDGQFEGIQFHVEFSQIAWIKKVWNGATVMLLDGRSFYLTASNDLNWYNKGIVVDSGRDQRAITWREFDEFRLARGVAQVTRVSGSGQEG